MNLLNPLFHLGRYVIMLKNSFARPENFGMYWKETIRQMTNIGVGSFPIIAIISLFIGAVTAVQFTYQLQSSIIPKYYIGYIVRDSMIIELGPTFSCLILAGKVGSNISSELGSMRISEQIDALEVMGINTKAYLVGPKIFAAVFIVPFLVIFSAFLGIYGGMFAAIGKGIPFEEYYRGLLSFFMPFNVKLMIIKSLVFSFILTSVACYQGYHVKGGALAIGDASTRSVVIGSIAIIIADYLIAELLL